MKTKNRNNCAVDLVPLQLPPSRAGGSCRAWVDPTGPLNPQSLTPAGRGLHAVPLCSTHWVPYQDPRGFTCGLSLMWQSPYETRVLRSKAHVSFIPASLVICSEPVLWTHSR